MVSSVPVQSFVAREFLNVAEEDDITFGVLFRVLLEKDILAFGVRRRCYPSTGEGSPHPPSHWFVAVCPGKDVKLNRQDQVYVIFMTNKYQASLVKTDSLYKREDFEEVSAERCKIQQLEREEQALKGKQLGDDNCAPFVDMDSSHDL